ncbi:hypothetical protein KIJ96_10885 [Pseudoalteromonas piscicida]|uniref:hypothetical protein n=1 Tax=Pseudoalteromonas TaxID=53246 RepID=UPI001D0A30AF|nr:hypothetical protein [Pseudoalteromonas piscicida]UDM60355.1 hypothetical protein KIJ96_10885 [Pseudoalteromonas piscicida]
MKRSWFVLLFCVVLALIFIGLHYQSINTLHLLFMGCIAMTSFFLRGQENIKHIVLVLLVLSFIEYGFFNYFMNLNKAGLPGYQTNAFIYSLHLVCDFIALMILKYRVRLSLRYMRFTNPDNWRAVYMTYADPILYGIYFAFVIVDLAAFGENIIRNLEYVGVNESFAKQFWSWSFIYQHYEILKSILLSCVITTLLATIFVERQRPDTPDEELESEPK